MMTNSMIVNFTDNRYSMDRMTKPLMDSLTPRFRVVGITWRTSSW